ncbi:hypothetical protein [Polynucleobacter necessarius]|uniref:hypothetical protein n=1 Tax=Polynucleobacter necessarius TaxID=576610 RepID=UPI0039E513B2
MSLLFKASVYGVSADSLISLSGFLIFEDAWPSRYLSPIWMWTLWPWLPAQSMDRCPSCVEGLFWQQY